MKLNLYLKKNKKPMKKIFLISSIVVFSFLNTTIVSSQIPNDSLYQSQYYISGSGINSIWNSTTGSPNSKISIIGIGTVKDHEDLNGRYQRKSVRLSSLTEWGTPNPLIGLIGANTNNGKGIAGINWNSSISVYDVGKLETTTAINKDGQTVPSANIVTLNTSGIVDDINASVSDGVSVIYLPINWLPEGIDYNIDPAEFEVYPDFRLTNGREFFFSNLFDRFKSTISEDFKYNDAILALKNAYLNDIVVVAAQNSYSGIYVGFPANFSDDKLTITVGSASFDGTLGYTYSSEMPYDENLDLVTFGVNLLTTGANSNDYFLFTGTKGAGAVATGIVSLLQDYDTSLSPDDIREVLTRTAIPIGNQNIAKTGKGLIDVNAAKNFIDNFTFQRGILTNGNSTKLDDNKYITLINGAWGNVSSGKYYADIYESVYELNFSPFNEVYAWFISKNTNTWSYGNPNLQRRSANIEIEEGGKIIFKGYNWFLEYDNIGNSFNQWGTGNLQNSKIGYTVAYRKLTQNTNTKFVNNENVASAQTYTNQKLYLDNNVTVTFSNNVNFNNTTVYLGENAKIEVTNGGKIVANNTTFKRLNPTKKFEGIYLFQGSDGSEFTNVTIEGGNYGIRTHASNNHVFTNSYIKNNTTGMHIANSDYVVLDGVVISNNSGVGLSLYNAEVKIKSEDFNDGQSPSAFRAAIVNNNSYGVNATFNSKLWFNDANIIDNGSHNIKLDNTSRVYAGLGSNYYGVEAGVNKFTTTSSGKKYIYSLALTSTGENATSWQVPAQGNYWEDGTAPSSAYFYGDVDYTNELADDPSVWSPIGDCDSNEPPYQICPIDDPYEVNSASDVQMMKTSGSSDADVNKSIKVKNKLKSLKENMAANENDYKQARWMKAYVDLLTQIEKDYVKQERKFIRKNRNTWLARFNMFNSLHADSLDNLVVTLPEPNNQGRSLDQEKVSDQLKYIQASQIVGESAIIMEMEEAFNMGKYNRIEHLYSKYSPHVTNKDNKLALLQFLVLMHQNQEEYGKALGALEQIELLQPDFDMQEDWDPIDVSLIRSELEKLAQDHGQSTVFEKALPGEQSLIEELPTEFELSSAYPNPFNPASVIPFALPESGRVRIEVYNITGRLVSVLVNQSYEAGKHQVVFDASNLASGLYLIRANLAGTIQSQKVTLIK